MSEINRLVNVTVDEVSFVDSGANQGAYILLLKRAEAKPTKHENGEDFPAEAYAYTPDPAQPSTWKLRLWETVDSKVTAKQVGAAVAALGPRGFRGSPVEIPDKDMPSVKAKVKAAWRMAHANSTDPIPIALPDVLKSETGAESGEQATKQSEGGNMPDNDFKKLNSQVTDLQVKLAAAEAALKASEVAKATEATKAAELAKLQTDLAKRDERIAALERINKRGELRKQVDATGAAAIDSEKVVDLFEKMDAADIAILEKVLKQLASAQAVLLKTHGAVAASSTGQASPAQAKFDQLVKSRREAQGVSQQQAEALILRENPDLYIEMEGQ